MNHVNVRYFTFHSYPLGSFVAVVILLVLTSSIVNAQDGANQYKVQSSIYTSASDELPFWFWANQNGIVNRSSTNLIAELASQNEIYQHEAVRISGGVNGVLRSSETNALFFSELYIKAEALGYVFRGGRFNDPIGLNNHELSIGSMMESNHATPVPKVRLSTKGFQNVPYTNGYLKYKGMFSHGWMERGRYIDSPYLHQKDLYLNVDLESVAFIGGIVHNTVWGGTDPTRGELPQSLADYLRVVTGLGASEDSNVPKGEVTNVIGNSVAAYEFGVFYEGRSFELSATRLFYLEDKVSTRFRSPWDGVWGLNLKLENNPWLEAFTYEHINTKQQDAKPGELIGRARYYNHSIYRSGWTYENHVLGLPLIVYDKESNQGIVNNIIIGHHIGVKGNIVPAIQFKTMLTAARHYGIKTDRMVNGEVLPLEEVRKDQYSGLLEINYSPESFESFTLQMKVAGDFGEFTTFNGHGIMIGAIWNGTY